MSNKLAYFGFNYDRKSTYVDLNVGSKVFRLNEIVKLAIYEGKSWIIEMASILTKLS